MNTEYFHRDVTLPEARRARREALNLGKGNDPSSTAKLAALAERYMTWALKQDLKQVHVFPRKRGRDKVGSRIRNLAEAWRIECVELTPEQQEDYR